jgi:chromate transporter
LFVLPSLFILIALSWVYLAYGDVPAVAGFLYGIKPAVTAIVVFAAYRIGSRALKNRWLWAIAVAAFVAIFALNAPFPLIVLAAGFAGYLGGRSCRTASRSAAHRTARHPNPSAPPGSTTTRPRRCTPASPGPRPCGSSSSARGSGSRPSVR